MKALLVKGGVIERIELDDEHDNAPAIRALIGNTFSTAFRVHLPGGLSIDGYCDDEFDFADHPDWNVVLEEGTLYMEAYAIGGPIVIVGGDNRDGTSREMSEEEMTRFWVDHSEGVIYLNAQQEKIKIPTLRYSDA